MARTAGAALNVTDLQCSDTNCYDPTRLAIDVAADKAARTAATTPAAAATTPAAAVTTPAPPTSGASAAGATGALVGIALLLTVA